MLLTCRNHHPIAPASLPAGVSPWSFTTKPQLFATPAHITVAHCNDVYDDMRSANRHPNFTAGIPCSVSTLELAILCPKPVFAEQTSQYTVYLFLYMNVTIAVNGLFVKHSPQRICGCQMVVC
jgi:hypothetical protein